MNKTQVALTVIHLTKDDILQGGQEYRLLAKGLVLTVPSGNENEFIIIEPLVNQSPPTKLSPASGVTLDGSANDKNVTTGGRIILCATSQNTWVTV